MYADQRSTVLAVDNLGGAKVLERTLRVDHVLNYKQLKRDEESGKMVERETQSSVFRTFSSSIHSLTLCDDDRLAAHPDNFKSTSPHPRPSSRLTYDHTGLKAAASDDSSDAESAASSHPSIDIDDPMRDYLIQQSREKKRSTSTKRIKGTKKDKEKKRERKEGESKEERKERRERKKIKLGLIVAPVRRDDTRRDDTRRIEGRDEEKGKGRSIEQERFSGDSRRVGGVRERAMDSYAATSSRDVDADRRDGHSRSTHHGREDDSRTTHGREDDDRRRDRGDGDGDASESRRRDSRREEDRRDSRREEERRDLRRDEERGGRKVSAFADLEKWAKGA